MSGSLVSPATRQRVRDLATPVATALGRLGLTPNALTVIGFAGTCVAAVAAANQWWLAAGVLVLAFGIFDLFDGALARATGSASRFGAFLDSTLDRTGESLLYAGIAVGAAAVGFVEGVAAAGVAVALASSVTYTRAKAESLGVTGDVGLAQRAERLVILSTTLIGTAVLGGIDLRPGDAFGARFDGAAFLGYGLTVIAILCGWTVLQRILHVQVQAKEG